MSRDPWAFQRWAFETETGNPIRKAVLVSLAVMADVNTGRCEALQETLCKQVEAGERAVRNHLKALEDMGLIARRHQYRVDGTRRGDEFLLLAPWVQTWPDGLPARDSGSTTGTMHQPTGISEQLLPAPKAGARTTTSQNLNEGGARTRADQVPEGFPEHLRPHAREVMRILRSIAADHGAQVVRARAVGMVIMRYQRRPLVKTAHDLALWAIEPPSPVRNVVQRYARFLENERDLEGPEVLGPDGLPVTRNGGPPPGITVLRRDRSAAKEDRQRRRRETAERLLAEGELGDG